MRAPTKPTKLMPPGFSASSQQEAQISVGNRTRSGTPKNLRKNTSSRNTGFGTAITSHLGPHALTCKHLRRSAARDRKTMMARIRRARRRRAREKTVKGPAPITAKRVFQITPMKTPTNTQPQPISTYSNGLKCHNDNYPPNLGIPRPETVGARWYRTDEQWEASSSKRHPEDCFELLVTCKQCRVLQFPCCISSRV